MSQGVKRKKNAKHYFTKKAYSKKASIEVNLKGFLCSCNNREKECIRESYNLLNKYADQLYGTPASQDRSQPDDDQEEDLEDTLSKEISDLKNEHKTSIKRFQVIDSGAKNFLFIRTTLENPVEIAEAIVKDIFDSKSPQTRFLLRLVPIETTCKAYLDDIGKAFESLADKYFKDTAQTFSIFYNHRNNNNLTRDEVIKFVANKVLTTRSDHKVDLKGANVSIIVEVIKGFVFLGVVPNYLKYKKYNLLAICGQQGNPEKDETTEDKLETNPGKNNKTEGIVEDGKTTDNSEKGEITEEEPPT